MRRQSARTVVRSGVAVIQVSELADSAVLIAVKPWVAVADFGSVEGELNLAIAAALRAQRIALPVPQREVRLLNNETVRDGDGA